MISQIPTRVVVAFVFVLFFHHDFSHIFPSSRLHENINLWIFVTKFRKEPFPISMTSGNTVPKSVSLTRVGCASMCSQTELTKAFVWDEETYTCMCYECIQNSANAKSPASRTSKSWVQNMHIKIGVENVFCKREVHHRNRTSSQAVGGCGKPRIPNAELFRSLGDDNNVIRYKCKSGFNRCSAPHDNMIRCLPSNQWTSVSAFCLQTLWKVKVMGKMLSFPCLLPIGSRVVVSGIFLPAVLSRMTFKFIGINCAFAHVIFVHKKKLIYKLRMEKALWKRGSMYTTTRIVRQNIDLTFKLTFWIYEDYFNVTWNEQMVGKYTVETNISVNGLLTKGSGSRFMAIRVDLF